MSYPNLNGPSIHVENPPLNAPPAQSASAQSVNGQPASAQPAQPAGAQPANAQPANAQPASAQQRIVNFDPSEQLAHAIRGLLNNQNQQAQQGQQQNRQPNRQDLCEKLCLLVTIILLLLLEFAMFGLAIYALAEDKFSTDRMYALFIFSVVNRGITYVTACCAKNSAIQSPFYILASCVRTILTLICFGDDREFYTRIVYWYYFTEAVLGVILKFLATPTK